jgi:phage repressor protein C with HTH and peptisase S24 domain/DNA-binding XRE family transcriptional regulator
MKNRIREIRKGQGLSLEQLAKRTDTYHQNIQRLETGKTELSITWMQRISRALGVTPSDLLPGKGLRIDSPPPGMPPSTTSVPGLLGKDAETQFDSHADTHHHNRLPDGARPTLSRAAMPKDVPVRGVVVAGESEEFYMQGDIVDYARRPPSLAQNIGVFVPYVSSTSMSPRYDPGDPVYVDPARPPRIGDCVVIELFPADDGERSGACYIKRLVRRTAARVICEQFTPPIEVEYKADRVKQIYRIIPLAELLAV